MNPRWLLIIIVLITVSCSDVRTPVIIEIETDVPVGPPVHLEETAFSELQIEEIAATQTVIVEEISTEAALSGATQVIVEERSAIIARIEGGLNSFILVGGRENGSWVSAENVEVTFAAVQEYQLYTPFEFSVKQKAKTFTYEPICNDNFVTFGPPEISQSAVGVTGSWDVIPRTLQELPTDTEVYLEAVASWLVEQTPSQPIVVINKIWKVDIEGDGTDEVFINATRFAEETGHNVEPRDYSMVLMRTVIGNELVTVELVADYYSEVAENQFPFTYQLEFIGDLNGDGRLEVVVGVSRWEGSGVMVFEIDGDQAQLVLSAMCSQ